MTNVRRRSLHLPFDDNGILERECPRCHDRFSIEIEEFENQGYMNLRCPYCRFISELDNFSTGKQRQYMYSESMNFSLRTMENILEDTLGGISGFSGKNMSLEIDFDDFDFGRVEVIDPISSIEVDATTCDDCGFHFEVHDVDTQVCPVCR